MGNFKKALEATTDRFRVLLPAHGFAGEPRRETGAAYRRIWTRGPEWKTDAVEIVYRRGGESSMLINFQVWLPLPGRDDPVLFDCRGVRTAAIPRVRWEWVFRRYVQKVTGEVERNMPWFDSFVTPKSCLESLTDPDRNAARSGQLVETMRAYLRSLAGSEHS